MLDFITDFITDLGAIARNIFSMRADHVALSSDKLEWLQKLGDKIENENSHKRN